MTHTILPFITFIRKFLVVEENVSYKGNTGARKIHNLGLKRGLIKEYSPKYK
jgi:hypothetical protein